MNDDLNIQIDIPFETPEDARIPQPVTPERIMSLPTKFGRNDLCPCGSGKKVKRCHKRAINDARSFQVYVKNVARQTKLDEADVLRGITQ